MSRGHASQEGTDSGFSNRSGHGDRRGTGAAAFRIIDSPMVPVIVPFQPAHDPDIVESLLHDLRFVQLPGGVARKLQPYLVQVPPKARAALIRAGAAEPIRPADFGDQLVALTNHHLYHPETGLDWDDPTFRRGEEDIF